MPTPGREAERHQLLLLLLLLLLPLLHLQQQQTVLLLDCAMQHPHQQSNGSNFAAVGVWWCLVGLLPVSLSRSSCLRDAESNVFFTH